MVDEIRQFLAEWRADVYSTKVDLMELAACQPIDSDFYHPDGTLKAYLHPTGDIVLVVEHADG